MSSTIVSFWIGVLCGVACTCGLAWVLVLRFRDPAEEEERALERRRARQAAAAEGHHEALARPEDMQRVLQELGMGLQGMLATPAAGAAAVGEQNVSALREKLRETVGPGKAADEATATADGPPESAGLPASRNAAAPDAGTGADATGAAAAGMAQEHAEAAAAEGEAVGKDREYRRHESTQSTQSVPSTQSAGDVPAAEADSSPGSGDAGVTEHKSEELDMSSPPPSRLGMHSPPPTGTAPTAAADADGGDGATSSSSRAEEETMEAEFHVQSRTTKQTHGALKGLAQMVQDVMHAYRALSKALLRLSGNAHNTVTNVLPEDSLAGVWITSVHNGMELVSQHYTTFGDQIVNEFHKPLKQLHEEQVHLERLLTTQGGRFVKQLREAHLAFETASREVQKTYARRDALIARIDARRHEGIEHRKDGEDLQRLTRKLEDAEHDLTSSSVRLNEARRGFVRKMPRFLQDFKMMEDARNDNIRRILSGLTDRMLSTHDDCIEVLKRVKADFAVTHKTDQEQGAYFSIVQDAISQMGQAGGGDGANAPKIDMKSDAAAALAATLPSSLPPLPTDIQHRIDQETCVWLNAFTGRMYRDMARSVHFHTWLKAKLETLLNKGRRPAYIDELEVDELRFGAAPPLMKDIRWAPTASIQDPTKDLEYDVGVNGDLVFRGGFGFRVSTKLWINWPRDRYAFVPVAVDLELEEFSGRVRFGVRKMRSFLSFLQEPTARFNVHSAVGNYFKMKNVPKLSSIILSRIRRAIRKRLVYPKGLQFRLLWPKNWWPEPPADKTASQATQAQEQTKGTGDGHHATAACAESSAAAPTEEQDNLPEHAQNQQPESGEAETTAADTAEHTEAGAEEHKSVEAAAGEAKQAVEEPATRPSDEGREVGHSDDGDNSHSGGTSSGGSSKPSSSWLVGMIRNRFAQQQQQGSVSEKERRQQQVQMLQEAQRQRERQRAARSNSARKVVVNPLDAQPSLGFDTSVVLTTSQPPAPSRQPGADGHLDGSAQHKAEDGDSDVDTAAYHPGQHDDDDDIDDDEDYALPDEEDDDDDDDDEDDVDYDTETGASGVESDVADDSGDDESRMRTGTDDVVPEDPEAGLLSAPESGEHANSRHGGIGGGGRRGHSYRTRLLNAGKKLFRKPRHKRSSGTPTGIDPQLNAAVNSALADDDDDDDDDDAFAIAEDHDGRGEVMSPVTPHATAVRRRSTTHGTGGGNDGDDDQDDQDDADDDHDDDDDGEDADDDKEDSGGYGSEIGRETKWQALFTAAQTQYYAEQHDIALRRRRSSGTRNRRRDSRQRTARRSSRRTTATGSGGRSPSSVASSRARLEQRQQHPLDEFNFSSPQSQPEQERSPHVRARDRSGSVGTPGVVVNTDEHRGGHDSGNALLRSPLGPDAPNDDPSTGSSKRRTRSRSVSDFRVDSLADKLWGTETVQDSGRSSTNAHGASGGGGRSGGGGSRGTGVGRSGDTGPTRSGKRPSSTDASSSSSVTASRMESLQSRLRQMSPLRTVKKDLVATGSGALATSGHSGGASVPACDALREKGSSESTSAEQKPTSRQQFSRAKSLLSSSSWLSSAVRGQSHQHTQHAQQHQSHNQQRAAALAARSMSSGESALDEVPGTAAATKLHPTARSPPPPTVTVAAAPPVTRTPSAATPAAAPATALAPTPAKLDDSEVASSHTRRRSKDDVPSLLQVATGAALPPPRPPSAGADVTGTVETPLSAMERTSLESDPRSSPPVLGASQSEDAEFASVLDSTEEFPATQGWLKVQTSNMSLAVRKKWVVLHLGVITVFDDESRMVLRGVYPVKQFSCRPLENSVSFELLLHHQDASGELADGGNSSGRADGGVAADTGAASSAVGSGAEMMARTRVSSMGADVDASAGAHTHKLPPRLLFTADTAHDCRVWVAHIQTTAILH